MYTELGEPDIARPITTVTGPVGMYKYDIVYSSSLLHRGNATVGLTDRRVDKDHLMYVQGNTPAHHCWRLGEALLLWQNRSGTFHHRRGWNRRVGRPP